MAVAAVSAPSGTEGTGLGEKTADVRERPAPVNRVGLSRPEAQVSRTRGSAIKAITIQRKRMPGAARPAGLKWRRVSGPGQSHAPDHRSDRPAIWSQDKRKRDWPPLARR